MQASVGALAAPFVRDFVRSFGADETAVYLVGSPALGDYSPRQSNLDLVAVTPAPAPVTPLARPPRNRVVLYTTWSALVAPPAGPHPLANPMTWAILAHHPVALHGPAAPAVHTDPSQVQAWFASQLPLIASRTSHLLWRRHLTRVVLQSVPAAHGARTGTVVSLREAGELALAGASHTSHRVITDALGYREGANTSMYWGPFERKSNAVGLAQQLVDEVSSPTRPARAA